MKRIVLLCITIIPVLLISGCNYSTESYDNGFICIPVTQSYTVTDSMEEDGTFMMTDGQNGVTVQYYDILGMSMEEVADVYFSSYKEFGTVSAGKIKESKMQGYDCWAVSGSIILESGEVLDVYLKGVDLGDDGDMIISALVSESASSKDKSFISNAIQSIKFSELLSTSAEEYYKANNQEYLDSIDTEYTEGVE